MVWKASRKPFAREDLLQPYSSADSQMSPRARQKSRLVAALANHSTIARPMIGFTRHLRDGGVESVDAAVSSAPVAVAASSWESGLVRRYSFHFNAVDSLLHCVASSLTGVVPPVVTADPSPEFDMVMGKSWRYCGQVTRPEVKVPCTLCPRQFEVPSCSTHGSL